jgi:hypothetical protein
MMICIADGDWYGDRARKWEEIDGSNLSRMKKTGKLKIPKGVS